MNNKGVTLIELIIYIALFMIVSLIIGKQFKALVNNYTAGKQLSKQQADSRDILGIMVRDIRNTGLKVYLAPGVTKNTAAGTWVSNNPADSSSFVHYESAANTHDGDTLKFYKARLKPDGDLLGVETITYFLSGTTLKRTIVTNVPGENSGTSDVAENVFALQFQYGINSADTAVPAAFGNSAQWTIVSGSTGTYASSTLSGVNGNTGSIKYTGTPATMKVYANNRYKVRIKFDPASTYSTGLNWMKFSFKLTGTATLLGSEEFLPRSTDTMLINVPVQTSGTADLHLEYSFKGTESLSFKGIQITGRDTSTFIWVNRFKNGANNTTPDSTSFKKKVRAIKIFVLTRTSNKAGTRTTTPIQVGNISFTPSGEYTWRLYNELVETLNNGVF